VRLRPFLNTAGASLSFESKATLWLSNIHSAAAANTLLVVLGSNMRYTQHADRIVSIAYRKSLSDDEIDWLRHTFNFLSRW